MKKILTFLVIASILNNVLSQTYLDKSVSTDKTMQAIEKWNTNFRPSAILGVSIYLTQPEVCLQKFKKFIAIEEDYDLLLKYSSPEDWDYILSGEKKFESDYLPRLNGRSQTVIIYFTIEIKPRKEDAYDPLLQYELKNIRIVFDDLKNYSLNNDTLMWAKNKSLMSEIQEQHCQWKIDDDFFKNMQYLDNEINRINKEIEDSLDENKQKGLIEKKEKMQYNLFNQYLLLSEISSQLNKLRSSLEYKFGK